MRRRMRSNPAELETRRGDERADERGQAKIDEDSDFVLVAFRLAGEMAVKRSRLHLVGATPIYTTRASIGTLAAKLQP
jgi:hypothetical protein